MTPWLLLGSALAYADCGSDLDAALDRAEEAFAHGRASSVAAATEAATSAWGCLERPTDPATAARLHRAHALAAHLAGHPAVDRLRAMRRADPFLPWTVAGPDHPLTLELHLAEESKGGEVRLLTEPSRWVLDGLPAPAVEQRLPVLVQRIEGRRVEQGYDSVGSRLPSARVEEARARRGTGWTLASVATGMVAAGLYGSAWAARGGYERAVDAGDDDRMLRMHTTTNGLTAASLGSAGLAVTFLAVGIAL